MERDKQGLSQPSRRQMKLTWPSVCTVVKKLLALEQCCPPFLSRTGWRVYCKGNRLEACWPQEATDASWSRNNERWN